MEFVKDQFQDLVFSLKSFIRSFFSYQSHDFHQMSSIVSTKEGLAQNKVETLRHDQ